MAQANIEIPTNIDQEIEEYAKKSGIDKSRWLKNAVYAYLARNRDRYDQQVGTLGWKQFIATKRGMIDKFDRAKEFDKSHKTSVYRGIVAESAFRGWISQFLPKRFGVASGYIISQVEPDTKKLSHFDVIIYDQLNSPVYWTEEISGLDCGGQSCAIPVEYVMAVIEVKASLTPNSAKNAIEHLSELKSYTEAIDDRSSFPKRYFPKEFCCAVVFFELGRNYENKKVGQSLSQGGDLRGYLGGLVLRPNDLQCGTIELFYSENKGSRSTSMVIPCGNGDQLSSFIEGLLARMTGEPKRRYCFPAWLFR
jgi:hypothetical protein